MAKHSHAKTKRPQPSQQQGGCSDGCIGTVIFAIFWIGFVVTGLQKAFPDEEQHGTLFWILLLLILTFPLWIKPFFRLVIKGIKILWAKLKPRIKSYLMKLGHNCKEWFLKLRTKPQVTSTPVIQACNAADAPPERIPEIASISEEIVSPIQSREREVMQADTFAEVLLDKDDKLKSELLSIDLMEGHQFEHWCAEALMNSGFASVSVTPGSGDQGVDVLAEKDGIKYAIQCKRYTSPLGNTPIQEVHSGKDFYHCHVGVVLTNQHFTDGAITLAKATGTLLWSREWIIDYLNRKYGDGHIPLHQDKRKEQSGDDLLPAAVDVVFETGIVSVSLLQRRLKLGYARASQLVDRMEEMGIVGPFQGSKPRAILMTKEQWRKMNSPNRND